MARLANLEMEIRATDHDGVAHEMTTTPSMWMLADEWTDTIRARGTHSEVWLMAKLEQAIWLQCLIENHLLEDMPVNLASIGEMLNRYEVETVETAEDGGSEDPTQGAAEQGPALR